MEIFKNSIIKRIYFFPCIITHTTSKPTGTMNIRGLGSRNKSTGVFLLYEGCWEITETTQIFPFLSDEFE